MVYIIKYVTIRELDNVVFELFVLVRGSEDISVGDTDIFHHVGVMLPENFHVLAYWSGVGGILPPSEVKGHRAVDNVHSAQSSRYAWG